MCALQLANSVALKSKDQHIYQSAKAQLEALSVEIDNAIGITE